MVFLVGSRFGVVFTNWTLSWPGAPPSYSVAAEIDDLYAKHELLEAVTATRALKKQGGNSNGHRNFSGR